VPEQPAPTWQPITKLPSLGAMIDQMIKDLRVQYDNLLEARSKPHVLDDATIARVKRVYGEQQDGLWMFDELDLGVSAWFRRGRPVWCARSAEGP
jgi:hypothetical protein